MLRKNPRLIQQLDKFRPRLWLELGLSADWGEEFISLIRLLEPDNHDPAVLTQQVEGWFARQRKLFQDLEVLNEIPGADAASQTCTVHAVRNAMECPAFAVNGRTFHLWSSTSGNREVFKEVAENMSNVVEAAMDRVQSELLSSIQCDWQVFHMGRWHQSQSMSLDELDTFEKLIRSRLRRLFRLAHEDADQGIRQFFQVVPILYEKYLSEMAEGTTPDNRTLWAFVFQDNIASVANAAGRLDELRPLGLDMLFFGLF